MMRRGVFVVLSLALCSASANAQDPRAPAAAPVFTLEQALQHALDHYPSVRAAIERVNASSADVSVARAAYLPRFDALWQMNRATANNITGLLLPQPVIPSISGPVLGSATAHAVWGSAAGGLFSWEAFDFGLRGAAMREAEMGVVRARAEADLTRLEVQSAVGMAFLSAIGARQAVTAAEADVQRRDVLARAARTLADNQLRPGAEASRAEAERAAAETRAIQARQALTIADTTLSRLLGIPSGSVAIDSTGLLETPVPTDTAPVLTAPHPLVQTGQAAVDLARAREEVLARTIRPRFYLQSSVFARGSGANPNGTLEGGSEGLGLERANWAAGLQVVFPNLFDIAGYRARRASAAALTRAETARTDEAALTVSSEQRAADALVAAARAIVQNTPIQLAAARLSETQARARYEAGLAGIVEVADAQSLLAAAEFQNAAAQVDLWRALLARAVARGSTTPFVELVRSTRSP